MKKRGRRKPSQECSMGEASNWRVFGRVWEKMGQAIPAKKWGFPVKKDSPEGEKLGRPEQARTSGEEKSEERGQKSRGRRHFGKKVLLNGRTSIQTICWPRDERRRPSPHRASPWGGRSFPGLSQQLRREGPERNSNWTDWASSQLAEADSFLNYPSERIGGVSGGRI